MGRYKSCNRINYIVEINAFYDWLDYHPDIGSNAITLWNALMHIANKSGWQMEFTVALSTLESKSRLKEKSLYAAREQLIKAGLLKVKTRPGRQASLYRLQPFSPPLEEDGGGQSFSKTNQFEQEFYPQNLLDDSPKQPPKERHSTSQKGDIIKTKPETKLLKESGAAHQNPEGLHPSCPLFGDDSGDVSLKKQVSRPAKERFSPPSLQDVQDYCQKRGNKIDAEKFMAHYDSNGWMRGKSKMTNWQQAIVYWEKMEKDFAKEPAAPPEKPSNYGQIYAKLKEYQTYDDDNDGAGGGVGA